MNNQNINEAIARLTQCAADLENTYIENEGECTAETEAMEAYIDDIKELLTTEGVDSLGRWLKAKEDEKKAIKAEKDYLTRKIDAVDNTIDYIKEQITRVMAATGAEKLKGSLGYSFTAYQSETTTIDKDALKAFYEDRIQEAITRAHIPPYVTITLGASTTKAREFGIVDGDEDIFCTTIKPSVRFAKPRAKKE